MATAVDREFARTTALTAADLLERFGPIPLWRIRHDPLPGTATVRDVVRIHDHENRLCELIDGILVEKVMGFEESTLSAHLIILLGTFVQARNLGIVAGEGGMLTLARGLVRIPDVSYVSRKRLPGGKVPRVPVPKLAPNLAVEILSPSNTAREMQQKLHDYFDAGVELVWYVDPRARTVRVFASPDDSVVLRESDTLTGAKVLPGFKVKVRKLFSPLDDA
ncbi:MAG: Uma2 family endonuclease [Planctomycetaceae bacterium]